MLDEQQLRCVECYGQAAVPDVDVVANAARLPFLPASLDSIACLALLEHVPDPRRVVAEIFRR